MSKKHGKAGKVHAAGGAVVAAVALAGWLVVLRPVATARQAFGELVTQLQGDRQRLDDARAAEGLYGSGARQTIIASGLWSEVVTLDHRYVTEDVALGLSLLESAARAAGAATRAVTGLLAVFGALLRRELSSAGRALECHGLGDLSRREIRALLEEGWEASNWFRVIR